jgi:uncharacterized protein
MKKFEINHYRYKKIKNKYLLTTDDGSYVILNKDNLELFKQREVKGELYDLLESKGFIVTAKNQSSIIDKTRERYGFLNSGTALHIIVVSLRCNMKCLYCQASSVDPSSANHDMSRDDAKKTVDFIFQSPSKCITIEFQGGEPLLNFDIIKYITEYAQEVNKKAGKDLRLTVVTNLNNIDDEKVDYLIKNNIDICTSLDGPKFIHDHNRPLLGKGGSYDSVIKWIGKINEEYQKRKINKKVGSLITTTKKTLDYPKAIVDEYVKHGNGIIHLRHMTNLGCASDEWDKIGYSPESFIKFWEKSMDYIISLNKKGIQIKERMAIIMLSKILGIKGGSDYLDLRSPCGAAIGQLVYNYDGAIYTCDEGRMVGNDIFKIGTLNDKYKDVLTSNQTCGIVSASVNDCFICDNCVYKPYCGLCPVCNYFEQGNIIAKIPSTPRCKIYMAMFKYLTEKYFFDEEIKQIFDSWLIDGTC